MRMSTVLGMFPVAQALVCRFGVQQRVGGVRQLQRIGSVQQQSESKMVEISANNLQMTDAMRDHVEKKLGAIVDRYSNIITRAETHLTVNRNPRVKGESDCAEVVIFTKQNVVVRSEERTSHMYASIDLVAHKLARKLRKLKERREKSKHKRDSFRNADADQLAPPPSLPSVAENDDDEDLEQVAAQMPTVDQLVRRKKFPMPSQSLEEAMEAIEYVDHDFYLFNNQGTLNVLYKRRQGGLGLIQPEEDENEVL